MASRWIRLLLGALLLATAALALGPRAALADRTQVTILEDDPLVLSHPVAALAQARALGITVLRLRVPWAAIAPATRSWRPPRFRAADPAAYGRSVWGPYDAAIIAAHADGIQVDLNLAPGAPRWATGRRQPVRTKGYPFWQWEPDPRAFQQFVQAVGERYSGNWNPYTQRMDPGGPLDLPRVSFWSVWNEPNYGPSLAPQGLPGHPGIEDSPRMYRNLVAAAWTGLVHSGHHVPADTIIVGELAPRSQLTPPGAFRNFNGMTPLVFLENLYCLDGWDRPWRGAAAALRGCPTTPAASRRFVARNPGLFDNSGISDHPYDEWWAPDVERDIPRLRGWALENRQDTSLATIGVLEHGLDRIMGAYRVRRQLPIWDTEYGYQTSPPHRIWAHDRRRWPSPATAAGWDNWAEYLHWRNPRIRSFAQYLIDDAVRPAAANDFGAFPSGLVSFNGVRKADYAAFQMPLYLPHTLAHRPRTSLEVWGDVRPAQSAGLLDGHRQHQMVTLLFRPDGTPHFHRIATLLLGSQGYYDSYLRFPTSGTLEARWTVPLDAPLASLDGETLTSRTVQVTVR